MLHENSFVECGTKRADSLPLRRSGAASSERLVCSQAERGSSRCRFSGRRLADATSRRRWRHRHPPCRRTGRSGRPVPSTGRTGEAVLAVGIGVDLVAVECVLPPVVMEFHVPPGSRLKPMSTLAVDTSRRQPRRRGRAAGRMGIRLHGHAAATARRTTASRFRHRFIHGYLQRDDESQLWVTLKGSRERVWAVPRSAPGPAAA